jgi:hypothetical protein
VEPLLDKDGQPAIAILHTPGEPLPPSNPAALASFLAAARALSENLFEADVNVRFRIILYLNKLHKLHPTLTPDSKMVETVLAAEIMGHYRSYQILGTLEGTLEEAAPS